MDNVFEIKRGYSSITVEKNGTKFSVEKSPDGDIWFNSLNDIELAIDFYSNDQKEWRSYVIFERLMKLIVGKYILSNDEKNEYSSLPKDFVDLEGKSIIWHSDSEIDNILRLQFNENKITVSIVQGKRKSNRNSNSAIRVRIRTNGSDYGNYYQEFECFFYEFFNFACQFDSMEVKNNLLKGAQPVIQKKLSIFNKFKK